MRILTRVPIFIVALLLLAACGKRQQAKNMVKDFVAAYAQEEIEINSFSDLDSTRVISDSLILVLRENAKKDPLFKSATLSPFKTQASNSSNHQTFLYIRMRYQEAGDTLEQSRTFYFDTDLTRIIAFK